MTNGTLADDTTPARLLATLRDHTGVAALDFAAPPTRLTGGFYAEMLRFRLTGAPDALDRDLVARIVPNPAAGAWEAAVQAAVAEQGFPTPAVRLVAPETGPLGRYLVVMDAVAGSPPLAGLIFATIASQIPTLVRRLPDLLARVAADLHALDPEPLARRLAALESPLHLTTEAFVTQQAEHARALHRPDVAAAGERLLAERPDAGAAVITHGDLHPLNLLTTPDGTQLIDWTLALVAHPAMTVSFTELMLANPPIVLPGLGAAPMRPLGRQLARRFLRTYRDLTAGTPAAVDDEQLAWHRRVHALRILVELAGWEAGGSRPPAGHPWLVLEPVARRHLGLRSPGR